MTAHDSGRPAKRERLRELWRLGTVATALTVLTPHAALAHAFLGDGGPAAGFIHPLTGLDHLLAMYAVGLMSAQIGGRALWTVPSAFVGAMIAGAIAGAAGASPAGTQLGVATSVLALGGAVALGAQAPVWAAVAAASLFGLVHGVVHGAEMPVATQPELYAIGFVVSTAGLHVLGALSALLVLCRRDGQARLRWAGAAVGVAGVYFVAAALWRTH